MIQPIALTMGEPAGIGGDIALRAWSDRDSLGLTPFFLIDDPARLRRLADRLDLAVAVTEIDTADQAAACFADALPVLALTGTVAGEPGRPAAADAALVLQSIDRAVALARDGTTAAMVTNPINKKLLYDAGFRHPGHTEYLAERCGDGARPVMLLACADLKVVPVTIHRPLARALAELDVELIVDTAATATAALQRDFALPRPRLAVAGLNPHAGEDGALGREEIEIIGPAVAALRDRGIEVFGPVPADTLFHDAARRRYDAAICMYHDQALIPIKTLDFHGGVNVTLGLPIVRTSPDHGTAFDLAGSGRANPASLAAALRLAAEIAGNRAVFDRGA